MEGGGAVSPPAAKIASSEPGKAAVTRPNVWFDISIGRKPAGRITFELFSEIAPRTVENFRA